MKHLTATVLIILLSYTTSAHSVERIPAFFILSNSDSTLAFDLGLWQQATQASGRTDLVRTYLFKGPSLVGKARRDASSLGVAPNIVILVTQNTPDKNSSEFQRYIHSESVPKDLKKLIEWPMCILLEKAGSSRSSPAAVVLMVLDNRQAKVICYTAVQAYFTTAPNSDGSRAAPIFVDPLATVRQASMPPMKFIEKFLADKTAGGSHANRSSDVYSRGEEIVIFASFDYVGRKLPGTPFGSYEIGLDIEVRDRGGKVINRIPNAHTYKGKSTQRFPLDAEYFRNHATAGVHIFSAGAYKVAFIFTDRSRPTTETAPIEAAFDVTVK